jgi:hypothetical protein
MLVGVLQNEKGDFDVECTTSIPVCHHAFLALFDFFYTMQLQHGGVCSVQQSFLPYLWLVDLTAGVQPG